MNNKNLRLIAIMLFGLNLIESPIKATLVNSATTIPTTLTPTVTLATTLYVGYNFLTRQKFLVSEKFKEAQTWYDTLAKKYPQANLDKIIFLQTPKGDVISDMLAGFAKKCSWTSSTNHIYMSKDTLKEINSIYKKFLDGYTLDDKEIGKLAGHEFTILHQAGHIKHNDAQTLLASIFLLFGATHAIAQYQGEDIQSTKDTIYFEGFKDVFGSTWFKIVKPGTLSLVSTTSFIAALTTILRYQETNADTFAIETADLLALKNGLKSFENDDTDLLYDLENKAGLSPYVETDSLIGKFLQNIVGSFEFIAGFTQHQLFLVAKSTKLTRMMFDFYQNPIQQSPFIRAQAIKDEIERRQESN